MILKALGAHANSHLAVCARISETEYPSGAELINRVGKNDDYYYC